MHQGSRYICRSSDGHVVFKRTKGEIDRLIGGCEACSIRQVAFHLGKALEALLENVVDIAHRKRDALPLLHDVLQVLQIVLDLTPNVVWQLRRVPDATCIKGGEAGG